MSDLKTSARAQVRQSLKLHQFTAGALLAMASYSLVQDYYGLERWIELVRARWVPAYVSAPVALLCIVWALWSCRQIDEKVT